MSKLKIANVLISDSWGEVSLDSLEKGIGGREGAMIYLSQEWARQGHQVTSFVNTKKSHRFDERNDLTQNHGYHEYVPIGLSKNVLENFQHDVVIGWECPSLFEYDIQTSLKICEMQVCHFQPSELEAAEQYVDYVAALSEWHKYFMMQDGLEMPEEKVVVFPNGVDISRYPRHIVNEKIGISKHPKFVYSSSPDRALWQLLESWRYIRKAFPGAELLVGYGVEKWAQQLKWSHNRQGQQALDIIKLMKQDGIKDIGKIGQGQLAELQLEADAWLYPLDAIGATESGCITAVENAAAGNPIITTDCDCMPSEFGSVGVIYDLPFNAKDYADCVEYILTDRDIVQKLREGGREFAEGRDWSKIAAQWTEFFKEKINVVA